MCPDTHNAITPTMLPASKELTSVFTVSIIAAVEIYSKPFSTFLTPVVKGLLLFLHRQRTLLLYKTEYRSYTNSFAVTPLTGQVLGSSSQAASRSKDCYLCNRDRKALTGSDVNP